MIHIYSICKFTVIFLDMISEIYIPLKKLGQPAKYFENFEKIQFSDFKKILSFIHL